MDVVGQNPRYRIEALLGAGGMGSVYRAHALDGGPTVALKLLRSETPTDDAPAKRARFRQEAEAASRVGHPGIVKILDYQDLPEGGAVIVMELLTGECLDAWLRRRGALAQGLSILADVAEALHCAHGKGIVHRDIKPQNIFLDATSGVLRPKILDFGIAKLEASTHTHIATAAGTVLGTPHYIAPERALGRAMDGRADLYSLGIMLYELLAGRVPFTADRAMDVLGMHIRTAPLDPRLAAPGRPIPKGLAELCLSLLAKKPDRRPRDAAIVARQLRDWARDPGLQGAEIPSQEGSPGSVETLGMREMAERPTAVPGAEAAHVARPRPGGIRKRWFWVAGLAGVAGVAGGALWKRSFADGQGPAISSSPAFAPVEPGPPLRRAQAPAELPEPPMIELAAELEPQDLPRLDTEAAVDATTVAVSAADSARTGEPPRDPASSPRRRAKVRRPRVPSPRSAVPERPEGSALPAFKDDVYAD